MTREQSANRRSAWQNIVALLLLIVMSLALAACGGVPGQEEATATAPVIPTNEGEGNSTPVASPTLAGEEGENATATEVAASTETPAAPTETAAASPSPAGNEENGGGPGTATPTAAAQPTESANTPEAPATAVAPGSDLQPIDSRETAFNVLASYYDAINRKEYERAYGYWRNPQQSFDSFVSGFAETASVSVAVQTPYFGGAAAGNRFAAMPVVLMAVHDDGSRHNFAGCVVAWSPSEGVVEPEQVEWALDRFTIAESTSTDAAVIDGLCADEAEMTGGSFDLVDGPVLLIGSYYNAIDLGDFERAYSYWQAPAQSFEDFAQGFANLDSVTVIAGMPYRREGAAGSIYAEVPVLVLATNNDGSEESYAGCFVAQGTNLGPEEAEQGWSLRDANLQAVTSTDLAQLATLCTG